MNRMDVILDKRFVIAGLLAKELASSLTEEEKAELDAWKAENPGHEEEWAFPQNDLDLGALPSEPEEQELQDRKWTEFRSLCARKTLHRRIRKLACAAVLLLPPCIGGLLYWNQVPEERT